MRQPSSGQSTTGCLQITRRIRVRRVLVLTYTLEDFSANDALDSAVEVGITVVVCAGNQNTDASLTSPFNLATGIVVGATDITDHRWENSNHGTTISLFAPGANIKVAGNAFDADYIPSKSGTSISAPLVAGLAARYLQLHPTATPAEVKSQLVAHASCAVSDPGAGSPNLLAFSGFLDGQEGSGCSTVPSLTLTSGATLFPGQSVTSTGGQYELTYQTDGNLVIYRIDGMIPVWFTSTGRHEPRIYPYAIGRQLGCV